MKIVFLGNFNVSYTSETHHVLSLESLGHKVIKLQEGETSGQKILEESVDADLFIWIHTHGWTPLTEMSIKELFNNLTIPKISYHLDLYMGIKRWNEYKNSELFLLDYFFTVDKLMARWLNENTKTKGYFIPAGVFDQECYLLDEPKVNEVVFVGSRGYHPEWQWRPQLIDWLRETYGDRFKHYGNDGLGIVRGDELNKLYANSKVVVGDSLCMNFDYPYYISDRLFETTGRGGFIIFPHIKGIENYFKIGKELITYQFGDFDGLKQKIDYYLTADSKREKIRRAGFERTKNNHTYKYRWKEILNDIFKNKN